MTMSGTRGPSGEKDQSLCPKCGRMYCEGYWGEGVCTADMFFGSEPTSRGDMIADYVRRWYELHRESWWERSRWNPRGRPWEWAADEFMLAFIGEVSRVMNAAKAEEEKRLR